MIPIWPEYFRGELKRLEEQARDYIETVKSTDGAWMNKWECIGQATLAMRHIEDARLRYGKVIQYLGDGESIFDKK